VSKSIHGIYGKDGAPATGYLDRDEIGLLAVSLGNELAPADLDTAMSQMDEDDSGEVDFDEFYAWWKWFVEQMGGAAAAARDDDGGDSSAFGGLYKAVKQSFLVRTPGRPAVPPAADAVRLQGGDGELALMMAMANGNHGCEKLLVAASRARTSGARPRERAAFRETRSHARVCAAGAVGLTVPRALAPAGRRDDGRDDEALRAGAAADGQGALFSSARPVRSRCLWRGAFDRVCFVERP
jgi:hypothetical protein